MVRLTLADIQSSLRLNVNVFDTYHSSMFCIIDVPQFTQFHKKAGLLLTTSQRFFSIL